jgi:uroporphyrinogen-III synthase
VAHASFNGLRVLALESRRAKEVEKLILTYGGEPIVVPAMREVGLESNQYVLDFAGKLIAESYDLVIFMTGVGVRAMLEIVQTRYDREEFLAALRKVKIAARGAKPSSALRELKVAADVTSEEPSTWHELLQALDTAYGDSLGEMRIAIQEYGASNPELLAELSSRSRELTKVPVYQWALPEDLKPLRECVLGILNGIVDVVLFMTAVQVIHLFRVAEQMGVQEQLRATLGKSVVVSIGPTTSEELAHYGLEPDFEPSRPKMGFMVNEAAQYAPRLLIKKRDGEMESVISQPFAGEIDRPVPAKNVRRVAASTSTMAGFRDGLAEMDFLHEISSRIAAADSLHLVLDRIVDFITNVIPCDSCFIYVLEGEQLVLRASKNPHADLIDHIGVQVGQGVTGWVAKHRQPVSISSAASNDPRFKLFKNIPEDHFEAMLCTPILCAGRVVGVINLQHRMTYRHTTEQVRLLSTLGFLVGAEIERARLESENTQLTGRLETRKSVDRAKNVLQRDLSLNEEDAYQMMQRESRQRRKSMREIAEAILLAEDLKRVRTTE